MTDEANKRLPDIDLTVTGVDKDKMGETIDSPIAAFNVIRPSLDPDPTKEDKNLRILMCDASFRAIGIQTFAEGWQSMADLHIAFALAVKAGAKGVVLASRTKNDPPVPTDEDIDLTRTFEKAASQLKIQLLDHLIIGNDGFCSMAKSMELTDVLAPLLNKILNPNQGGMQ